MRRLSLTNESGMIGNGKNGSSSPAAKKDMMESTKKAKAALMADNVPWAPGDVVEYVYGEKGVDRIRALADLHPARITSENLEEELLSLEEVEVIFSCWGMLKLSTRQLERLPALKAVFYASGSVAAFAAPFMERGVLICNGVEANAIPVAEFSLAQILLAMKDYWNNTAACRRGPWEKTRMPTGPGVYGETVALLGVGAISRHLLQLLSPFHLRVLAVSGYLASNPEEAEHLGIDGLVDIETAFREAYVVSNHLPDRRNNQGILKAGHFASMRKGATFINTGRGGQVDEDGLVEVLKSRPDLTALLDVQHPEPPDAGSELYTLPNVHLTSHIAGSTNDEVRRMADFVIDDFERWTKGEPLHYSVNPKEFSSRA